MFRKLIIISAWASIVMVFYATVTDVGFVYSLYFKLSPFLMQTDMRSFARFEHVIAFACVGAIFSFAYPLEYLQTWTPDGHGTFVDACEKIVGGGYGISAAHAIHHLAQKRQSRRVE
jgi:hypothetical protein